MKALRATYRLQFHENFRLVEALALVPYLHSLGISHLYASPLFAACAHSTHGYDVCDFSRLNPELGTEDDLSRLVASLREKGMGLVLDIVPNHMGIGTSLNSWWWDVLKNGRASAFARHFDIDWEYSDPELRGKILLPVLGAGPDEIREKGELQISRENGEWVLCYHEHRFPLATGSVPENSSLEKINSDVAVVREVLQRQNYHLTFYADPAGALNYRRFFAINTLAGVRVEEEEVFNHVHALVGHWISRGWLAGLRVDHPDGLRDPEDYLRRLRQLAPDQWIVIEKILMPGENLPGTWPVQGTSGYDFLNVVNGLFIDPAGERPLTDFYSEFTGEPADYPAIVRKNKRMILDSLFPSETARLTGFLVSMMTGRQPGFTHQMLGDGLKELVACFPVYRSYLSAGSGTGGEFIEQALAETRRQRPDLPASLFDFFAEIFFLRRTGAVETEFIARFQQLTGAVMAKGAEDTAFYQYNRFISLNEVGGHPGKFGGAVKSFHSYCRERQKHWPYAMLATSTHDTKRSEDVRARLNVLSEMPDIWSRTVRRWSGINARHRRGEWPDGNLEYFFYQTLAGVWPAAPERILACLQKSMREAAQHTDWTKPNRQYESAVETFINEVLGDSQFTEDLQNLVNDLTGPGQVNSLAQTLIKLTAPGVPDIYQGCELWDFSLVDPDNRRAVDFELRERMLAQIGDLSPAEILKHRAEGWPKVWLIHKTLAARAREKDTFEGDYEPIYAQGRYAGQVIAFMRQGRAMTVVPRLVLGLKDWLDTSLELPAGHWHNVFTAEDFCGSIRLADLFATFPVGLLVKKENH